MKKPNGIGKSTQYLNLDEILRSSLPTLCELRATSISCTLVYMAADMQWLPEKPRSLFEKPKQTMFIWSLTIDEITMSSLCCAVWALLGHVKSSSAAVHSIIDAFVDSIVGIGEQ